MNDGVKIGSRLWLFDQNRRVYPKPEPGRIYSSASPIYAEHFIERVVIGENRASWFVASANYPATSPVNVSKKTLRRSTRYGSERYYTDAQKADDIWLNDNRSNIVEGVRACRDMDVLKQIAALLGNLEADK